MEIYDRDRHEGNTSAAVNSTKREKVRTYYLDCYPIQCEETGMPSRLNNLTNNLIFQLIQQTSFEFR
jgi:hypothetical protein